MFMLHVCLFTHLHTRIQKKTVINVDLLFPAVAVSARVKPDPTGLTLIRQVQSGPDLHVSLGRLSVAHAWKRVCGVCVFG